LITYCPGRISKEQIESVNYEYANLEQMQAKYNPKKLQEGFNDVKGEEIFLFLIQVWDYGHERKV